MSIEAGEMFRCFNNVSRQNIIKATLGFKAFFEEFLPVIDSVNYQFTEISGPESFDQVWGGKGFYLIASSFEPSFQGRESCHLSIDGLPVIYRGQADRVGERVRSHLDNSRYREVKGKTAWQRCMKLNASAGDGGIDFDDQLYGLHRWAVLVLPLRKSNSEFRNCAEWGFDAVFGKPIASNERSKAPSAEALQRAGPLSQPLSIPRDSTEPSLD